MLNEEFIDGMFPQQNSKDHQEQPLQQVSLNFTVSSRSSKNNKKQLPYHHSNSNTQQVNIFSIAEQELNKFEEWLRQSQSKSSINFDNIQKLLEEVNKNDMKQISEGDIELLRSQIGKKQSQKMKQEICQECIQHKIKINQLEQINFKNTQILSQYQHQLQELKIAADVEKVKQQMINQVQINMLHAQISQLNGDLSVLRSQKSNLQRTFLFNKTKNSDILLQKSKGLSAAKNSTNSSQLMNRNQTIVFIDPVESDIEEWLKFFDNQINRYKTLCRNEEDEKKKQYGRKLTKDEKKELHSQGRLFIIYSSLKVILSELTRIRENTKSFLNIQSSKSFIKDKFNISNHSQNNETGNLLKQQNQRMSTRLNKLLKLNDYLMRQKNNLQQINQGLKTQRILQNTVKNKLEEEIKELQKKIVPLMTKIQQYQNQRRLLMRNLQMNESQLFHKMGDLKKYKKTNEGRTSSSKNNRSSSHKVQFI